MNGNLRTLADVERELRFMETFLARLKQSFLLEKEEALLGGSESLWTFRERSRSHYNPSVSGIYNDIRQLRHGIIRVEKIPSGIFLRLEALERAVKEAQAHFTGTPNRLLRFAGQNTGDD